MGNIKAVIFDMDGVLVDSEIYWQISRVEFAKDRNKNWTPEFQREAMGQSTVGWAKVMKRRLDLEESVEDIIVEMKNRVIAHYEEKMPVRDGALEAVDMVAKHFRVGLASGSPTDIIKHVMRLTGLDKVFETIVYGDTVPNGKPAPDIYFEALSRLDIEPAYAVGIEDSSNGVRSLHNAGMFVIAAPSEEHPLSDEVQLLADVHITSMHEITLSLLNGLHAPKATK